MINNRYLKYYKDAIVVGNVIWRVYQKMIIPVGPVSSVFTVSNEEKAELFRLFKQGVLIRPSRPFDKSETVPDKAFYAVICQNFIPVEELNSKRRNEINRGLNNCTVRKTDFDEIQTNGYEVFAKAHEKYNTSASALITKDEFIKNIKNSSGLDDIIHFWGVYYKDRLIAWAQNQIHEKAEANYSVVKFDPEFLNQYPSYALFYKMNEYYLKENGFACVNDGYCSLLHQTNIQDYLIGKFGFEKHPVKIGLLYRKPYNMTIKGLYPFRSVVGRLNPQIKALLRLHEIYKSQ